MAQIEKPTVVAFKVELTEYERGWANWFSPNQHDSFCYEHGKRAWGNEPDLFL